MQLVPRHEFEDWFFRRAKLERPEIEARARAQVVEWRWLKGIGNPLDPEPLRWQRLAIPPARPVQQIPTEADRNGHHEVGLDHAGRPWIAYQYAGTERPYLTVWMHEPGWIRSVRYGTHDHYDFTPPEVVALLELDDQGRVIGKTTFACPRSWPSDRPLTDEDIDRLSSGFDAYFLRERYHWDGDRLIAADLRSADDQHWLPETELEWPDDKRKRTPKIYRILPNGQRQLRKGRR